MQTTILSHKYTGLVTKMMNEFSRRFSVLYAPHRFFTSLDQGTKAKVWPPLVLLSCTGLLLAALVFWVETLDGSSVNQVAYLIGGVFRVLLIWLGWIWVSGLIRSIFIITGVRCPEMDLKRFVAMGIFPFVVRDLIRMVYLLSSRSVIVCPGLSGLLCSSDSALEQFISMILAQFDLYFFWHAVLLWVGLKHFLNTKAPISSGRSFLALSLALLSAVLIRGLFGLLIIYIDIPFVLLV